MTPDDDDRDLRERFAAARREDRAQAPDFRQVLASPRGRARAGLPRPMAASLAVALAALVALTMVGLPSPRRSRALAPSITAWRPATDFLLQTPGREILGVPRIGEGLLATPSGANDPNERRTSS